MQDDAAKTKVLVLASNPTTQKAADATLKKLGYKDIVTLDNGIEALKRLMTEPFGLIICDQKVRFISGWAFVKEMKTSDKVPNLPVLLMGEDKSPATEEELRQYGLVSFLKAPPVERDLSFLISSTLTLFKTSGTIENKFTKAKIALVEQKAELAVELYSELQGLTKKGARSSLGLAEAFVQKGDTAAAEKVLNECKADDAGPAMTLVRVKVLLQKQLGPDAEATADGLLKGSAAEIPYYYSRALQLFMDFKRYDFSEKICAAAIERQFKIPEFHISMARCAYEKAAYERCLEVIKQASDLFGPSADGFNLSGVCLRKVGQLGPAIAAYEQALKLTPMDAKVYFNMAVCAIAMKNYQIASGWLETCLKIAPGFPKAREKIDEIARVTKQAAPGSAA